MSQIGQKLIVGLQHMAAVGVAATAFAIALSSYWRHYRGTEFQIYDPALAMVCLAIAASIFLLIFLSQWRSAGRSRELHWQTIGMGGRGSAWGNSLMGGLLGTFVLPLIVAAITFVMLYVPLLLLMALWRWSAWMPLIAAGGLLAGLVIAFFFWPHDSSAISHGGRSRVISAIPLLVSGTIGILLFMPPRPDVWLIAGSIFVLPLMTGLLPLAIALDVKRLARSSDAARVAD